jgi:ferritin-like protein
MSHIKQFQEFSLTEKIYSQGKNDAEANKTSFYESIKLKEDQKKLISELVDKTASEDNVKIQSNYKVLILGKLAGLDEKQVEELEKNIEEKDEDFVKLILLKLSGLSMDQAKAFQEL